MSDVTVPPTATNRSGRCGNPSQYARNCGRAQSRQEPLGHPAATDVERLSPVQGERHAGKPRPRRELGRAAAGIGHHDALAGKVVRHAVERQTGLDLAGNHLRAKPQVLKAAQQRIPVRHVARGTRERGAHGIGREPPHPLHEAGTGGEHAIDRCRGEQARGVHALAEVGDDRLLAR